MAAYREITEQVFDRCEICEGVFLRFAGKPCSHGRDLSFSTVLYCACRVEKRILVRKYGNISCLYSMGGGFCRIKSKIIDSDLKSTLIKQPEPQKNGFGIAVIASGLIFILLVIMLQGILKDGITSWMPTYMNEVFGLTSKISILMNVFLPVFSILCVYFASILYLKVFKNELTESLVFFLAALVLSIIFYIFKSSIVMSIICAALITGFMHRLFWSKDRLLVGQR